MGADLVEKTELYGEMLSEALAIAHISPIGSPSNLTAAEECIEMANAYLRDGYVFYEKEDYVNALAAFSYGYGWLDSGVRFGILEVPEGTDLFTV
tara:strand:+ start:17 stop:301 length:285 start_codon:yes stop_codon:yes gene_type:complete